MRDFDPDRLLSLLPRRTIALLPIDVAPPQKKSVGSLSDYNGFSGKERLRTFQLDKWLVERGALKHEFDCGICSRPANGQHAENYYDLTTWIDLCHSCHGRLHKRFNNERAWTQRLEEAHVPADHWANAVAFGQFDLAGLLRQRGKREPVYTDFIGPQE